LCFLLGRGFYFNLIISRAFVNKGPRQREEHNSSLLMGTSKSNIYFLFCFMWESVYVPNYIDEEPTERYLGLVVFGVTSYIVYVFSLTIDGVPLERRGLTGFSDTKCVLFIV